jgi:hypothetical protein
VEEGKRMRKQNLKPSRDFRLGAGRVVQKFQASDPERKSRRRAPEKK